MAADSRTTVRDAQGQASVSTDYAEKIFPLGACVVGTSGWAQFAGKSVAEHVAELRENQAGTLLSTPTEVGRLLGEYFRAQYLQELAKSPQVAVAHGQTIIEFLVAGQDVDLQNANEKRWSSVRVTVRHQSITSQPAPAPATIPMPSTDESATTPSVMPAQVVETAVVEVHPPLQIYTATWSGMADAVRRLIMGYDGVRINLNPQMHQLLRGTAPIIPYPTFTLQDAANFSRFLVEMTIMVQKFQWGWSWDRGEFATVGGRVDVAVIDRNGFRLLTARDVRDMPQLSDSPIAT